MSAYVIVEVEVTDPDTYAAYREQAAPIVAQYGGRYLARGGQVDVLEGDWHPTRLVLLEFPSMADAHAWWSSAEYAEPKARRMRATNSNLLILDGVPPV